MGRVRGRALWSRHIQHGTLPKLRLPSVLLDGRMGSGLRELTRMALIRH